MSIEATAAIFYPNRIISSYNLTLQHLLLKGGLGEAVRGEASPESRRTASGHTLTEFFGCAYIEGMLRSPNIFAVQAIGERWFAIARADRPGTFLRRELSVIDAACGLPDVRKPGPQLPALFPAYLLSRRYPVAFPL